MLGDLDFFDVIAEEPTITILLQAAGEPRHVCVDRQRARMGRSKN